MKEQNVFARTYYSMITENTDKTEKSEAQNDYDAIMNAVLDEFKLKDEKRKAIADLLYMYKNEKFKMEAIVLKMKDLMGKPDFFDQYSDIMQGFAELKIDWKRFQSLQEGFNKMVDNPNYDNRRNFMRRVARWLEGMDAEEVVKLHKIEKDLRDLVKKYTVDK